MRIWKISVTMAALAVLPAGAAYAQAKAELTVNDTNPIGAVGDKLLSLDEAVRLANGTLAIDKLSAAERAQVQGAPGARSRDLIALPQGATLTMAKGAEVSPLTGNDGDILDGHDATLVSGDAGKGLGLFIASSNFTLRNVQARGFATAVRVDFGGLKLVNISLQKLRLFGAPTQSALLEIGATKSNGSLRGVSVADSVFDTEGLPGYSSLVHVRAAATPPGATVDNVMLEGFDFVRNRLAGGGLGIYLTGSLGAGRTTNAVTRNALVADNVFVGQHDSPLNLVGGLPAADGHHTKVVLENVVARGNRIEASEWGIYMGNEMFGMGQRGSMTDSHFRNITVEKNVITRNALGSRTYCIIVENTADYRGDRAVGNVTENIKIADNDITGCVDKPKRPGEAARGEGTGVIILAGRASIYGPESGGGTAQNNVARNIEISNNRIKDSNRGIVLAGGYALDPGQGEDRTSVTGNRMTGVRIVSNRLENNATGIRIAGGDGAAGTTVTGNSVDEVTIRGNEIVGSKIPCETVANARNATGNIVNAACPASGR